VRLLLIRQSEDLLAAMLPPLRAIRRRIASIAGNRPRPIELWAGGFARAGGARGPPFAPARHNAVMHVEDESAGENTVVEVFQQGYALGDKILRFAMVKVAN